MDIGDYELQIFLQYMEKDGFQKIGLLMKYLMHKEFV